MDRWKLSKFFPLGHHATHCIQAALLSCLALVALIDESDFVTTISWITLAVTLLLSTTSGYYNATSPFFTTFPIKDCIVITATSFVALIFPGHIKHYIESSHTQMSPHLCFIFCTAPRIDTAHTLPSALYVAHLIVTAHCIPIAVVLDISHYLSTFQGFLLPASSILQHRQVPHPATQKLQSYQCWVLSLPALKQFFKFWHQTTLAVITKLCSNSFSYYKALFQLFQQNSANA